MLPEYRSPPVIPLWGASWHLFSSMTMKVGCTPALAGLLTALLFYSDSGDTSF